MATVSTSATKGIYDLELITLEDLLATALQNLNQSKRLDEYLSYLTSEWYTTPEDLRLAYQNDKIWSQITLPGRLKLELIKLIEKATDSQSRPPVTTIDQRIMTTTAAVADMLKELSPILSEKVPCVATTATTTTTDRLAWTTELDQNRSRAVDHNVELTETDQQIYAIDYRSAEAEVEAHDDDDDDVGGGSTVQAADSSSSSFSSSEWVCCISQEHHCYYYYNISTFESTWEPPEGVSFESVHEYDEHLQQWIALPDDYDVSNHNNYQDNNNNNNDNNDDGDEYYVQLESYEDVNISIKHHDSGNYNNTNNDDNNSLYHLLASSSPSPVKLSSSAVKKRIIIVDVDDDDDDSSSDSNGPESPSCNDKTTTILQFNDIYGGEEGGNDDKEADLSPKIIGPYRSHFFQSAGMMIDGEEVPVVQIGQHHHHSVSSRSIDAGSSSDDVHNVSNNNNNNNRPSYDDDNNPPRRPNNPFDYFGEGGWVFSSDQNDYEWVEHLVADPKDDAVAIDDTFAQYQPTEYYVDEDYDRELVASLQAYEFDRDGDDDDFHEYDDAPSAVGQDASLIAATTSTVDATSEEDKAAKLLFIHPSAPIDDDDEDGGCRYGAVNPSSPLRINNLFPNEPSTDLRILDGPSPSRLTDQHNDQLFRLAMGSPPAPKGRRNNNGKKEKRTKLGSLFRMSLFGKANPPSHPQLPSSPPPLNASPVKLKSTSGPTPIVTKISNNNDDDDDDVDVHRTLRNDSQSNSHNTSSTTYLNSINYHRSSKKDRSMNFDRSVNSSVNSREALSSTTRTATTTTYPSSTASSDATSTATIKKGSSSSSSSRGTSLFKKTAAAGLQYFNRPTKSKATEEEGGGGLEEDFDRHLTVVQQLRDMGYSEKEVVIALNASGHNLEAALTMLNEDRGTALDRTDGVVP